MASTNVRVQTSLSIRNGNLTYQNQPTSFQANQVTANGPTPGAVRVSHFGTAISLAELGSLGGFCRIMNLDPGVDGSGNVVNNFVSVGIMDLLTHKAYYLMDLLPGESYVIRLSQLLGESHGTGSGTGTAGSDAFELWAKADIHSTVLLVEAFDP